MDGERGQGVYVTGVALKSPAYHGGLRVADVIQKMDGCEIGNMKDLRLCLATHEPGDRVQITVCRECSGTRKEKTMRVTLR